ncbi:MAG: hypothetical protein WAS05_00090 [Candidatus Nanopelagicales bacterium]
MSEAFENAKDKAGDIVDSVKDAVTGEGSIGDKISDVADKVKESASGALGDKADVLDGAVDKLKGALGGDSSQ